MSELKIETAKEKLIEMFYETNGNSENNINKEILAKHNFSLSQWECFVSLSKDLELNEDGISILLDEIYAGRVLLPCDE
jgi:hypothetical protein